MNTPMINIVKRDKDFEALAKQIEKFMQKYCHPHNTLVATLEGVELLEGVKGRPFKVLD